MKPFRFRLDRLRRLKEAEQRQQVLEMATARRQLEQRELEFNDAVARMDETTERYAKLGSGASNVSDWLRTESALKRQKALAFRAAEAAHKAAVGVEEVRERLIAKSREVEVYARLRRRKREQHDLEMRRAEQKDNDARALERHAQLKAESR
jgi:flagellar export protein FliJ